MICLTGLVLRTSMVASLMAISEKPEQGRFDDSTSAKTAADRHGICSDRGVAANPRTARREKV
jgi:hypothetical protein